MSHRTVDREKLKAELDALFASHTQATMRLCEALITGHGALIRLEARETEKAIEEFEAASDLFVGVRESLKKLHELEQGL